MNFRLWVWGEIAIAACDLVRVAGKVRSHQLFIVVFIDGTGNLFYNQNGVTTGLGSGAQFATLRAIPALSANDFMLQA